MLDYQINTNESSYYGHVQFHTSTLIISGVFEIKGLMSCTKIAGFRIWRAYFYGIFAHFTSSFEINDVMLSDNVVSLYIHSIGPASLSHACVKEFVKVKKSVFVGDSGLSCTDDMDKSTNNYDMSQLGVSYRINGGFTGISWFMYSSAPSGLLTMAFKGNMGYPALCSKFTVEGTYEFIK